MQSRTLRRLMAATLLSTLVFLYLACEGPNSDFSSGDHGAAKVPSVIGDNSLIWVNDYDDDHYSDPDLQVERAFVQKHKLPVGTISRTNRVGDDNKFCSGTLIGEDIFITAGHCYYGNREYRVAGDTDSSPDPDAYMESMYVVFNYEYEESEDGKPLEARNEVFYPIDEVIEHRPGLGVIDYMVLRLGRHETNGTLPGNDFGWARIPDRRDTPIGWMDVQLGDPVVIIGHPKIAPHKGASLRKRISIGRVRDFELDANDPTYNYRPALFKDAKIRYDNDTIGGNSGSGVLTTDGLLVGVHVGGPDKDVPVGSEKYLNEAMGMQHLYRQSDFLRSYVETRQTPPGDDQINRWWMTP